MKLKIAIIVLLVSNLLLSFVPSFGQDMVGNGYIKPDPVPAFMRQPCLNNGGASYWNCYYDARTMYKDGRSKRSLYYVKAYHDTGKEKNTRMVCYLYWNQKWAAKHNTCFDW